MGSGRGRERGDGEVESLSIELPTAQAMKFAAMTVVFFVCPATLRDTRKGKAFARTRRRGSGSSLSGGRFGLLCWC